MPENLLITPVFFKFIIQSKFLVNHSIQMLKKMHPNAKKDILLDLNMQQDGLTIKICFHNSIQSLFNA